jgi:hypothetical protein
VVHIADLFASRRGLAVLRRLTLLALPRNPLEPRPDPGATWGSYRFFALTPRGLDIAFPQGVVGSMADGEPLVTIPYAKLASVLSPLGRRLVAGVRAPVSR